MNPVIVRQLSKRIFDLLEAKYRAGGKTLSARVKRLARRLPPEVRQAAKKLADADRMARDPKKAGKLEPEYITELYVTCLDHLMQMEPESRFAQLRRQLTVTLPLQLCAVAVLAVVILRWRGLI